MWWPASDAVCHIVIYRELRSLDRALCHVADWSVAVQAGGNVGVWPLHLGEYFAEVVTFEPDPENYECLSRNVAGIPCVKPHHAALGESAGACGIRCDYRNNCGAPFVEYGAGDVPVATIDGLDLPGCGLLALDLEGAEPLALAGAVETIGKYRPVIMLEHKGHGDRFGFTKEDIEAHLARLNYRIATRLPNDIIAVPQ
jgi:FkbM family methyltransferase